MTSFENRAAYMFPGLQCEDEARHEEALVWPGHVLPQKWQYLTATRQGVARYSLMKYTSLRNKQIAKRLLNRYYLCNI